MIEVKGLAVPYNVADVFAETLKPNSLVEFLERWKTERFRLPMLWEHQEQIEIGHWTAFANRFNALYLRGLITSAFGEHLWRSNPKPMGLSIGLGLRGTRQFQHAFDLNRKRRLGKPVQVNRAFLGEVSITANPAFPGTWIREIK